MGGDLNFIDQWGNCRKRREENFDIAMGGEAKGGGGNTIFDSRLVGGGLQSWRKICFPSSNLIRLMVF